MPARAADWLPRQKSASIIFPLRTLASAIAQAPCEPGLPDATNFLISVEPGCQPLFVSREPGPAGGKANQTYRYCT